MSGSVSVSVSGGGERSRVKEESREYGVETPIIDHIDHKQYKV